MSRDSTWKTYMLNIFIAFFPGSSECAKCVLVHPKNIQQCRNFTYLEHPDMYGMGGL